MFIIVQRVYMDYLVTFWNHSLFVYSKCLILKVPFYSRSLPFFFFTERQIVWFCSRVVIVGEINGKLKNEVLPFPVACISFKPHKDYIGFTPEKTWYLLAYSPPKDNLGHDACLNSSIIQFLNYASVFVTVFISLLGLWVHKNRRNPLAMFM